MSKLSTKFKIKFGRKTIEGIMTVPDDDGTSHLPMIISGLLKQVSESVPESMSAKSMTITASIEKGAA